MLLIVNMVKDECLTVCDLLKVRIKVIVLPSGILTRKPLGIFRKSSPNPDKPMTR
jgi:hypothetical protein